MMDSWEDMAAHLEDEYRQSEDEADPEAPGHVDQLIAGAAPGLHSRGLERPDAVRTGAGMVLANFRVPGARPERPFGCPARTADRRAGRGRACTYDTGGLPIVLKT